MDTTTNSPRVPANFMGPNARSKRPRNAVRLTELLASQLWIEAGWIEPVLMDVQAKSVLRRWCVLLAYAQHSASKRTSQMLTHEARQPKQIARLAKHTMTIEFCGWPSCEHEVHVRPQMLVLRYAGIRRVCGIGLKTVDEVK